MDNTIEGNKAIAVFMNISWKGITVDFKNDLKYHTSWDWLMPIVEKIEHCEDINSRGYSFHVCIFDKDCEIYEYLGEDELPIVIEEGESKIKATWLAVVEFIKWYNQNKK